MEEMKSNVQQQASVNQANKKSQSSSGPDKQWTTVASGISGTLLGTIERFATDHVKMQANIAALWSWYCIQRLQVLNG